LNKENFLNELTEKLSNLSKEEREKVIQDYEKRFDEARIKSDKKVIGELGDVDKIAEKILNPQNIPVKDNNEQDTKYNSSKKDDNTNYMISIVILILVLVILAPVIIPVALAILAVFIGLFFGGIGVSIAGFIVSSIGVISLIMSPANGLLMFGIGFILLAIGILLTAITIYVSAVAVPLVIRGIVYVGKLPFKKGE